MTQTFSLAHLSDVHLAPLVGFGPRHWGVKRLTGYVNWQRKRRHVHLPNVVGRIVADVRQMHPDHIAVTGDLVNIGLPQELIAAQQWLAALGPPDRVTAIPGNHDIYAHPRDCGVARWAEYMATNADGGLVAGLPAAGSPHKPNPSFPFVRRHGSIAIIGLNSAVPTPPLLAIGRMGGRQLARLCDILDRLGRERVMRIVLVHHPPMPGQAPKSRALTDAPLLTQALAQHGAELVLHGHNHVDMLDWLEAGGRRIPVVGVASASVGRPHGKEPLGRYNLYRITPHAGAHRIEMLKRGLARPDGPVVEIERTRIGD
jgi:3',5'-cyclic AMP phosphodiesterase CpdA